MNNPSTVRQVSMAALALGLLLAPAAVTAEDPLATVDNTTSTVDETVNNTTATQTPTDSTATRTATATPTDSTLNDTTDTLNDTTDTLNDTTDSTTSTLTDTVDGTTDTVDDTTFTVTPTSTDSIPTLAATETPTDSTLDGTTDTLNDTVNGTTDTVDGTTDTVGDTTDGTTENLTGTVDGTTTETSQLLTESGTSDVGMVLGGSTGQLDADYDATVALLEGSNATSLGMAGGGSDENASQYRASDDDAAAGSDGDEQSGSGTPLPDVPPEGAAIGALGAAAVGAALVKQGTLTAGPATQAATTAKRGLVGRLTRLFAPFRYSRFDDSDPLEHEARVEMLDAVESAPGTYLSEMAEQADLPLSTARHHVRVLEREDLVASAKVRGRRRFYPGGTEGLELAAAMNDEATATILDALARLGPSSVSGLAEEVGRDPSTVTHHLKRLEEDDIVVRERDGRAMVNRLSPEATEALDPGLESEETADVAVSAD